MDIGGIRRIRSRKISQNPTKNLLTDRCVGYPGGKGNSNSLGARPVHQIITMIKWIRTRRLSIKNSLSLPYRGVSLIRNRPPLGPYSSIRLGPCGGPRGGGLFLMSEVPLYPGRGRSGPSRAKRSSPQRPSTRKVDCRPGNRPKVFGIEAVAERYDV